MSIVIFKRILVFIFPVFCALFTDAQQIHFVYLQTENAQPFYVKLNNKVVSSSAAGYLILPKLVDGDYGISVGFPKKEFPEENFQIVVDKKNEGFLLKNFGEKGWGLFNMQSYAVIMGGGGTAVADTGSRNLQTDPFSKMLANVVKDSSILQKNEVEKPAAKKDLIVTLASPDTVAKKDSTVMLASTDTTAYVVKQPPVVIPVVAIRVIPKKILSNKNEDGVEMLYTDSLQNGMDTVEVFIPKELTTPKIDSSYNNIVQPENVSQSVVKDTLVSNDTALLKDTVSIKNNLSKKDTASINNSSQQPQIRTDTTASTTPLTTEDNKALVINRDSSIVVKDEQQKQKNEDIKSIEPIQKDSSLKEDTSQNKIKKETTDLLPQVVNSSSTNSDCKAFANNDDFLKLRKKMAAESSDDDMIKAAKKIFRSKCFSTEQIKNLSFLFLTNEGKYRFFDEAYAFASDSNQYFTLQSQLSDSYYITRFKAMIHK